MRLARLKAINYFNIIKTTLSRNSTMSNRIETVGIIANLNKLDAIKAVKPLMTLLSEVNIKIDAQLADKLKIPDGVSIRELGSVQIVIVLGGDGTVLAVARKLAPFGVPILGINMGRLGFLTELLPNECETAIPNIIAGDYDIEERMMLQVEIPEHSNEPIIGLNEVTIDKGASSKLMSHTIYVSNSLISHVISDGLIIATPTGSTAYSMAAGGAIISPSMDAFIITALAPYTLAIRPLLVSGNEIIKVYYKITKKKFHPHLTIDGQVYYKLPESGSITVRRSKYRAKLISYHRRSFYDILRTKLGWGPPPSSI
jgi:NAD+ kinase